MDLTEPVQLNKAAESVAKGGGLFVPYEGQAEPFKEVMVVLQIAEQGIAVPGTVVNIPPGGGGFYVHFKDGDEFEVLKGLLPAYEAPATPPPAAAPVVADDPPKADDPMAPTEEPSTLGTDIADDDLPDWLKEGIESMGDELPEITPEDTGESREEAPAPESSSSEEDEDIPEWLRDGIQSLSEDEQDEAEWEEHPGDGDEPSGFEGQEEVPEGAAPGKPEGPERPKPAWEILDPTSDEPIHSQVRKLSLAEKLKIARTANRPVRELLIRDTEKRLHAEVIRNPKITDEEIMEYTAIPSLSPLVLEWVSKQPKHMRRRGVMLNLVQNPMTPPDTARKLLPKLSQQELLRISRSSRVRQVISRAAKKMLMQKGVL